MRYEARNSASVNNERPSQLMAQVKAQLEAVRSAAFVPDNVSSTDEHSSIWSDEDVEEQDELDEIEDAQTRWRMRKTISKMTVWRFQWISSAYVILV